MEDAWRYDHAMDVDKLVPGDQVVLHDSWSPPSMLYRGTVKMVRDGIVVLENMTEIVSGESRPSDRAWQAFHPDRIEMQ